MRVRGRTAGLVVFGAMAATVVVASLAWACTAQVGLSPLTPLAGPSNTKVAVQGTSDRPGPVEIRWNGVKGPLLGTAVATQGEHGTDFSTEIAIPESRPGAHYLVVVPADSATGVGRAAFDVLPSAGAPVAQPGEGSPTNAADAWSTFGDSAAEPPAVIESTPAFAAGMVLLGVGLVALTSGFAVASLRRRSRAGTTAPGRTPAE